MAEGQRARASSTRPSDVMRIGMPTTSYPDRPGDAAGRFVRHLAMALVRRGHEIEVLAPQLAASREIGRMDPGISVRRIPYLRPRSLQRNHR